MTTVSGSPEATASWILDSSHHHTGLVLLGLDSDIFVLGRPGILSTLSAVIRDVSSATFLDRTAHYPTQCSTTYSYLGQFSSCNRQDFPRQYRTQYSISQLSFAYQDGRSQASRVSSFFGALPAHNSSPSSILPHSHSHPVYPLPALVPECARATGRGQAGSFRGRCDISAKPDAVERSVAEANWVSCEAGRGLAGDLPGGLRGSAYLPSNIPHLSLPIGRRALSSHSLLLYILHLGLRVSCIFVVVMIVS